MALDSGTSNTLTLEEDSLVIIYAETPEDVPVAIQLKETGGVRKAMALSTD